MLRSVLIPIYITVCGFLTGSCNFMFYNRIDDRDSLGGLFITLASLSLLFSVTCFVNKKYWEFLLCVEEIH